MLVLVDQDQVLADFGRGFDAGFTAAHPGAPHHPRTRATSYWIEDDYAPEWHERVRAVSAAPGFFRHLPVIPGAVQALHAMLADGHDVRICTAPLRAYRHCVLEKFEWVEEHLGAGWTDRVVLTRDKTLLSAAADVLIDDKPDVVGAVRDADAAWTRVYFDAPYNLHLPGRRLHWGTWRRVLAEVERDRAARGVLRSPRRPSVELTAGPGAGRRLAVV
ncbi:5' nucleotidase, NT5C type [Kineococcus gypseus]|uniref:5' nucleotidase, NT5C type n=1 Tax=Kineococcus gypseus TaxID=1637102 RepID=UPI003D7C8A69